jgi:hypothetical protein
MSGNLRAQFEPMFLTWTGFVDSAAAAKAGWDQDHDLTAQVAEATAWLQQVPRTKRVDHRSPGSYGLKHEVEDWARAQGHPTTYVSNGAFLMAAIQLGFIVQRPTKAGRYSPNALINISRRR